MDSDTNSCADDPLRERRIPRALLATIGHELRTPLTSIRGYIETLLEGEFEPATARRFLETARREALRLGRLVDGMLEFSLLDLSAEHHRGRCDVVEQIVATMEMLSPMASARRVTIRTQLPETAFARVDGDACVHALANLIENAIKHGRERGAIDIACVRETPYVAVSVEDDGNGVDERARASIFAMGVRGDTHGRAGRGIGLAVVKAIAERAGGEVYAESSALGGARFVLRFVEG